MRKNAPDAQMASLCNAYPFTIRESHLMSLRAFTKERAEHTFAIYVATKMKNKSVKAVKPARVMFATVALIVKNVNCWIEFLNNAKAITIVAHAEKYLRMRFGKHLASINSIIAAPSPANVFAKPTR